MDERHRMRTASGDGSRRRARHRLAAFVLALAAPVALFADTAGAERIAAELDEGTTVQLFGSPQEIWVEVLTTVVNDAQTMDPEQAQRVAEAVTRGALEHGLHPLTIAAVIRTESAFRPEAVSNANARGLMQIRPFVGEWLAGETGASWVDDDTLFDPVANVELGVHYLAYLVDRFGGDLDLALAAYNWGPTRVARILEEEGELSSPMKAFAMRVWASFAHLRRVTDELARDAGSLPQT